MKSYTHHKTLIKQWQGKGVNFGLKSTKLSKTPFLHPLETRWILGLRDGVSVFSTHITQKHLLRAFHVIAGVLQKRGRVLFINTQPEFWRLCSNVAHMTRGTFPGLQNFQTPLLCSVSYKWVGGTLTNWKQVSKSVVTFAKFSQRCQDFLVKNGMEFPKYTRVKRCFQGLFHTQGSLCFTQKPDLIFLVNPHHNQSILDEACRLNIPVIALADSNTDPGNITYPVPVNTYSPGFAYYCLKKLLKLAQLAPQPPHGTAELKVY